MSPLEFDWGKAKKLDAPELRDSLFRLLQSLGREIQIRDQDDPELLSVVPRMLELLDQRGELTPLRDVLSAAARSLGLWNYIDKDHADARERLLAEAVTYPELGNIAKRLDDGVDAMGSSAPRHDLVEVGIVVVEGDVGHILRAEISHGCGVLNIV